MTVPDFGVNETGFYPPRLEDVRQEMRAQIESDLGQPVDPSPNSVIGVLLGVIAYAIAFAWSGLQGLWDALSPARARGAALDDQAATVGVYRHAAARARTRSISINGQPGAVIAPGLTARGEYRGEEYLFTLIEPATVDPSGVAAGYLWEALEPRAVALPAGVITDLTSGAAGANSVTQSDPISGGRDRETDDELRQRRQTAFLGLGGGNDYAVAAAVAALPFIGQSRLRSNRNRYPQDGLPGNSFAVIVYPSSGAASLDADQAEELAITIARVQGQGSEPFGDVHLTVVDSQGVAQPIAFSYADRVAYRVRLHVVPGDNYAGDPAVVSAVVDASADLSIIGEPLYASAFVCPSLAVMGVKSARAEVATLAGAWGPVLNVDWNQIAVLDGGSVEVEIGP